MREQWEENLKRKIENQIQRIAEIQLKQIRLKETEDQLYKDLAKNQRLLSSGPKAGTQERQIISEDLRQKVLSKIPTMSGTSLFGQNDEREIN